MIISVFSSKLSGGVNRKILVNLSFRKRFFLMEALLDLTVSSLLQLIRLDYFPGI